MTRKILFCPRHHCIGGFDSRTQHYIERANRENYLLDLSNIDGESMTFTLNMMYDNIISGNSQV